jgi:hypothetical protein
LVLFVSSSALLSLLINVLVSIIGWVTQNLINLLSDSDDFLVVSASGNSNSTKSRGAAHRLEEPSLKSVVVSRRVLVDALELSICIRGNMNKVGERWNLIFSCQVGNDLTVYLENGNLVGSVPVHDVIGNLVKIFLYNITPLALLHIEVDEDVLVLKFATKHLVEIAETVDRLSFGILPPLSRDGSTSTLD